MTFTRALCRRPGPDFADGLTTADLGRPDHGTMLAQHEAYVAALRSLGLEVAVLDPLPGHPDAYFVEDAALVFPELAVVTRPGAGARRAEAEALAPALARHRELFRLEAPATLDGGDVLAVGKQVYAGLSERTNAEGVAQLGRILAPHGYTVTGVPVAAGLHFKSSVNWVGGDALLLTPDFAGRPELAGFRHLVVEASEAYAANTLWINGTLLTPAGFPRTRALLEGLGLPVLELDTSEARKMDGGLTCLSLRF
ncbi:MAG: arginine deiminase family protein [Holophagaceae bacterium]